MRQLLNTPAPGWAATLSQGMPNLCISLVPAELWQSHMALCHTCLKTQEGMALGTVTLLIPDQSLTKIEKCEKLTWTWTLVANVIFMESS